MNSSLTCEYASLPPFVPLQLILSARQTIHSLVSSTHPSLHHCALTQVNTSPHPPSFIHYPALLACPQLQLRLQRHGSPHDCCSDRSDLVIWAWLFKTAVKAVEVSGWRQGTRTSSWWLWTLTVWSISAHLLVLKGFLCTLIKSCSDQVIPIQS